MQILFEVTGRLYVHTQNKGLKDLNKDLKDLS